MTPYEKGGYTPLKLFKGGIRMKVKILAIIISILILALNVPVYANTETPEIPELPSNVFEYWVIVNASTDPESLTIFCSHNPIKVEKDDENNTFLRAATYKTYTKWNNGWLESSVKTNARMHFRVMYYANHDIAYYDGSGFFFRLPNPRLYQMTRRMDFGTVLKNFSVGLIPILGLIVLFIAFRKAWAFLLSQLQS